MIIQNKIKKINLLLNIRIGIIVSTKVLEILWHYLQDAKMLQRLKSTNTNRAFSFIKITQRFNLWHEILVKNFTTFCNLNEHECI